MAQKTRDDDKRWNLPTTSAKVRELMARLDVLEREKWQEVATSGLQAQDQPSDGCPYPDFESWQKQAMLDLIHNSGAEAVSWKRLHIVTSTLGAAWAGLMLTRGETYDKVQTFMDWVNEKADYVRGFQTHIGKSRRSPIVNQLGNPGGESPEPDMTESVVGAEDRNAFAVMQAQGLIKGSEE